MPYELEHKSKGDPCAQCGRDARDHHPRPEHKAKGDPCAYKDRYGVVCGLPSDWHRGNERRAQKKERDALRPDRQAERVIVGIDGEGYDAPDGRHFYVYLAAVDEHGRVVAEGRNPKGLTHEECVAVLARIPENTLKFGFMFSYDLTKILAEMHPADCYYLFRPDSRRALRCLTADCKGLYKRAKDGTCAKCGTEQPPREVTLPVYWRGRSYDYLAGSLTLGGRRAKKGAKRRNLKIWDCFRFFGTSFVNALRDWKISTDTEWFRLYPDDPNDKTETTRQIERIASMKGKRGALEKEEAADVEAYCKDECHLLAKLMRKVITSHTDAGIPLKRFEGAGSTASALLKKYAVDKHRGPRTSELPFELQRAIRSAFFGGRFEDSAIGVLPGPVYGYDISSAYPYAMVTHPCLACGEWKKISGTAADLRRRCEKADAAVLRFRVKKVARPRRDKLAWCPLPCRTPEGSIAFGTNFTGWAWREELFPALNHHKRLVELQGEAWIYTTPCEHRPFAFMPKAYRERVKWGKEGPGKCLKLGINAGYGKTAQTVGGDKAPFHSLVWAGMTTARTRGMIIAAIGLAKDPWNVLAVATDGIYVRERLALPKPEDTGTSDLPKPLGGWEEKEILEGCFIVKPGLYWRLETSLADIRARGVGRKEIFAERNRLIEGFLAWDRRDYDGYGIPIKSKRFHGAKSTTLAQSKCGPCNAKWIGVPEKMCPKCKRVGTQLKTGHKLDDQGRSLYGQWSEAEITIKFDPLPKRERRMRRGGKYARLYVRDLGGIVSSPYAGKTTPEGLEAAGDRDVALEQPDWDDGTEPLEVGGAA